MNRSDVSETAINAKGRWAELLVLFVAVPAVLALLLPPGAMYPVLIGAGLLGVCLLHVTDGFSWRELFGPVFVVPALVFGAITLVLATGLCLWLLPDRLLFLPRFAPVMLLLIAALYPLLLVLPQELIYRPLFYCRYGRLFRSENQAVWANATLFSFAHLMYWHWVVFTLTFVGSFIFSNAYLRQNSFPQALVLHAAAGIAIFASGLGWLFYSGGYVAQN
ncbi:MAG: CPBP family intramembrane metalloprotease [Rhodobacteraceae bacterium]|nr:CPBP family intramembrane metalloprotease [Paracoccaceae bacterium]